MLSASQVKNIEKKWNPAKWPANPASDYAKVMHKRPFTYFLDRVQHLGMSGKFVIDAGCGTGTWSFALANSFDRVLGIDYTHDRLELAKKFKRDFKMNRVEFVEADIRKIPVDDGVADAVFCYSVALGSVPLETLYAEFYRVLRPGGVTYLELNGIGYGYALFHKNPTAKKIGADVVYNTYCRTALAHILPALLPGSDHNSRILDALEKASPLEAIKAAGGGAEAMNAGAAIVDGLGAEYAALLAADMTAIAQGRQTDFSKPSTGRGYTPDDLSKAATKVGYRRFEWAHEGTLSIQADGSVKKGKSTSAPPISAPDFEGHLLRFEALTWK